MGEKKVNVMFRFASYEVTKFQMDESYARRIESDLIDFNLAAKMGIDIDAHVIVIFLNVKCLNREDKIEFCEIETKSEFQIQNFNDVVVSFEDDKVNFSNEVIPSMLLGLAYSTTRGALTQRASGTTLQNTLLPVVDPKEMTKALMENTIKEENERQ